MSDQPKKDKSTGPGRDKSTSPSRDKRGGGGGGGGDKKDKKQTFPTRIEREGSRRRHDRVLSSAEARQQTEDRQDRRQAEIDSHTAAREARQSREPKGLGGRAARRGR